jgi:hypothetical protein
LKHDEQKREPWVENFPMLAKRKQRARATEQKEFLNFDRDANAELFYIHAQSG